MPNNKAKAKAKGKGEDEGLSGAGNTQDADGKKLCSPARV
jgi:hypothetical protein